MLALPLLASASGEGFSGGVWQAPTEPEASLMQISGMREKAVAGDMQGKRSQPKSAEEIRRETVASTVHAAHELVNQGKNSEALAKLKELDSARVLQSVSGKDGAGDLARYWMRYVNGKKAATGTAMESKVDKPV